MVGLKRISSTLGLLAAMTSAGLAQDVAPNANQLTADAVAGTLRMSRNLEGYRIEIQASGGLVTLTGALGNPAQKAEVLDRARQVAGVSGIVDQLQVSNDTAVRPVQYQPNPRLAYHQGPAVGGGMMYGGRDRAVRPDQRGDDW